MDTLAVTGLLCGEGYMILTSTVFDRSTRKTEKMYKLHKKEKVSSE